MLCISPVQIVNPKPQGTAYIAVPCGKCAACLTNRRNDWSLRLQLELENSTSAHFVTLTYSDENIYYNENQVPSVKKKHVQDYLKRLRKNSNSKIRYYAVGEYGTETDRPHYHLLIFNIGHNKVDYLETSWNNIGHVAIGTVTHASIHYITKYHVNKAHVPELSDSSFALMSRRPGIGSSYIEIMKDHHKGKIQNAHYTGLGGQKRRLPRYLRDKLYTKKERAQIASKYEKMHDNIEKEKKENHYLKNQGKNYYQLEQQQKSEFQRKFKNKINEKNTF